MILTREILYGKSCEMLQKTMVVYKIQRLEDGKIYIGKTTRKLAIRIREHLNDKRTNSYIDRTLRLQGIEAFDVSIVEECGTSEELNEREVHWIAHLNCKYPNGFNLTDGSDGTSGFSIPLVTRKKISVARMGQKKSPEAIRKTAETIRGSKRSAETRKHMSDSSKNKRPVVCIETNKIFQSITAAAKWAGVSINVISNVLHGRTKIAGGCHWRFSNSDVVVVIEKDTTPKHYKKVRCLETGEIFPTITAAAKWAGVAENTLCATLHGKQKTSGKKHWEYVDADK